MLRAIILAVVVVVALGTIIPVATEQTEASATQEARQFMKKERAEKFRYRSRFRLASYSASNRFMRTAKLREPGHSPAARITPATTARKVRSTKKGATVKRKFRRSKTAKSRIVKAKAYKRYRKVRRYSGKRRVSRSNARRYAAKRTARRSTIRKYSTRWWKNYRAQQAKKQELAKIKSAMRARRDALVKEREFSHKVNFLDEAASTQAQDANVAAQLVMNADGSISMVLIGDARGDTVDTGRRRTLAGVSTVALRRTVIDEMIRENGWVENDYHKLVDGQKVYVVVAKAPDRKNRIQAMTFYFAESGGKIYRVSASAPKDDPEQAAEQSEKMVRSLQAEDKAQQAEMKKPPEDAMAVNKATQ